MPTLTLTKGRTPNLEIVVTDWSTVPVSLTYEEAAQVARTGLGTIREAVQLGQLVPTRLGRRMLRISRYQLQAYLEQREIEPLAVPYYDIPAA